MFYTFLIIAIIIIALLAGYAGFLLTKLYHQNTAKELVRQNRINDITESIQTIAKAVSQQQCELSEASIRLCRLLIALPIAKNQDYSLVYPALHELYDKIKHMPTHEERANQDKLERHKMDIQRGQWEAELETAILKEVEQLILFNPGN